MRGIIYFLLTVNIFASNGHLKEFQNISLKIVDDNKTIIIKRYKNKKCADQHINPKSVFGGSYIGENIPKNCTKSFITTLGILQPMHLFSGVTTVGELEVLSHIKKARQKPDEYILIDTRRANWYKQMTIPTAVNLPVDEIPRDDIDDIEEDDDIAEFNKMIEILGIIKKVNYLDFSRAKSAIIFCNASWCSQSQKTILRLLNLGYPKEKLLWYRGGMQDWLINGFTVVGKDKVTTRK